VRCISASKLARPLTSRRQGASVEDMTAEVNKARAALETAQRDLKSMASLNRVSFHNLTQPLRTDDVRELIGPQAIPSSPVGEMA
jgi:hypothetical protein